MRLSSRSATVALALGLAAAGTAAAASPAQEVASTLKPSMQRYYTTHDPGTRIGRVSCSLNAAETKGTCRADFTIGSLDGLFVIDVRIDRSTGELTSHTVSASCHLAKTGKSASCF